MFIVGLTGSLGTGKSVVASMFASKGIKVIDADKVVHHLLKLDKSCQNAVTKAFGDVIKTHSGIDRKELAQIVFKKPSKLKQLEKILHPRVRKEMWSQIAQLKNKKNKIVILEIPLLFESRWQKDVDMTIVVKAKQYQQINRACARLKISKAEALRRIRLQMPLKEKIRKADFIIDNGGNLNKTKKQVELIWQDQLQKIRK